MKQRTAPEQGAASRKGGGVQRMDGKTPAALPAADLAAIGGGAALAEYAVIL